MKPTRHRNDDGSILPLTIFFGFFSIALVFVVVAASSLYLERARLFGVADAAALVGAESYSLETLRSDSEGTHPVLSSGEVHRAVEGYLHDAPNIEFDSLHLEAAKTVDGQSAVVRLTALWRPPVIALFAPDGLRIEVTSTARSVFN